MEWKEKGKREEGEETHTISHNTHTACGGGSGGVGNQFHCLPLSKCISIYNPWNSVCALGSVLEIDE